MRKFVLMFAALALLAGCSSEPQKAAQETKKQPPKNEIVTGRVAFQRMYQAAYMSLQGAKPFRFESVPTKEASGVDGKAGVWRGFFGSETRGVARPFVWSGVTAEDAPSPGISPAGPEDTWTPSNVSMAPFDIAFLKVDSDKAFEVAQKHGGEAILKKKPDTPIKYLLDWSVPQGKLIWHVEYGEGPALTIDVDATTGDYLRTEK